MNNLDKKYTDLLQDILDNGITKKDRTGTGTLSVFGRQIRHNMSEGFPLLTTKKMYFKGIVTELLWFLRGDTNIKYLVDNNCHIWDGDAYKNYLSKINNGRIYPNSFTQEEFINKIKTDDEFAKTWGELGPVYGKQWRQWSGYKKVPNGWHHGIPSGYKDVREGDQIENSINLLKTDPDSRRNKVSAWNVGELDEMTLPPCHTDFQFYTRELSLEERSQYKRGNKETYPVSKWRDDMGISKEEYFNQIGVPNRAISLMWNQRSVDTFLGLPFNIASYGLLLEIFAKLVNMVPEELIGNLGDTHLYLDHIEQAKEQIGRELSLDERKKLYENEFTPGMEVKNDEWLESKLTTREISKRTREPYPLPTLNIKLHFNNEPSFVPEHWLVDDFEIVNYKSHSPIKAPLSN